MTRCFVAIDPGEKTRAALERLQSALSFGRPMAPETLHLTLAFLDEQPDETLEALHDALSAIRARAFSLKVQGLGTFGGNRPHALWAGAAEDTALTALHKSVVSAARRAGITVPARRFVPHVTIARLRPGEAETPGFMRFMETHGRLSLPPESVAGFTLYASTLRPEGARHDALAHYPLI